eukprot:2607403-Pleurochrysis_carterae.AAC.1
MKKRWMIYLGCLHAGWEKCECPIWHVANPRARNPSSLANVIHVQVADGKENARRQWFGEEVGQVVDAADEGHNDL